MNLVEVDELASFPAPTPPTATAPPGARRVGFALAAGEAARLLTNACSDNDEAPGWLLVRDAP